MILKREEHEKNLRQISWQELIELAGTPQPRFGELW
jgi:hypothetical protein